MLTLDDLHSFLDTNDVRIVHFSHHAEMRAGVVFPDDLQAAIANRDKWNLSCCAIWPSHKMALPGDVGVLFELSNPNQILSVFSGDSGSHQLRDGPDFSGGDAPSTDALRSSLKVPKGAYNEWRIRGASVAGIYINNPAQLNAKCKMQFEVNGEPHEVISSETIQVDHVRASFPDQPLFTHKNGNFVEI